MTSVARIGVLALQGDFAEHIASLRACGVEGIEAIEVRTLEQLAAVDGLIIPGGESTTIARLLICLLYTSPSPRDGLLSRMPSSA